MPDQERNDLIPCVIIKKYDNFSDSDESIIQDGTSKKLIEIPNDDESSIVVSSTLTNPSEQNDEFHVNHKSMKSIHKSVKSIVTMPKKKCVTIASKIKLVSDVNISSGVKKIHWFHTNKILVLLTVSAVFLLSAASNFFVIQAQSYEKQGNDSGGKVDCSPDYTLTTVDFKFKIISRSEWKARKPIFPLSHLRLPSTRIIIAHTATSGCSTQASCSSIIRAMQKYHFRRGWTDITYNFLVGSDGSAYEGRGWNRQGSHFRRRYNHNSISIAFIGTFTEFVPPQPQIIAAQKLIKQGLILGKLASHYRLYGHRQVLNTKSPGDALYSIIKGWDHWSNTVV